MTAVIYRQIEADWQKHMLLILNSLLSIDRAASQLVSLLVDLCSKLLQFAAVCEVRTNCCDIMMIMMMMMVNAADDDDG